MIKKLLSFVQSPVGDTIVVTKSEAVEVLQYQQQLEMNSMLAEVLIYGIMRGDLENTKEYTEKLMNNTEFMVAEFMKIKGKNDGNPD